MTAFLGTCTACGTPYDECPISDDATEWDTDENGNHEGLCCEDCEHLAEQQPTLQHPTAEQTVGESA